MSIISDALKKAQRDRSGPDEAPPMPGSGGRAGRREQSARSLTLMVSGAVVLVVAAVGVTIFVLRPSAPSPAPAAAPRISLASAKAELAPPAANTASQVVVPLIVAPASTVAAPAASAAPASAAAATPDAGAPAAKLVGSPVVTKSAKGVPPDPRIIAYVDAIKVTGIRASGGDSKVLMNDHVYRVNDVVERLLNVRLTEVNTDNLTFVDGNDVVYTKNF